MTSIIPKRSTNQSRVLGRPRILTTASLLIATIRCTGDGSTPDSGSKCVPADCSSLGFDCGEIDDGKGGCSDCGRCERPNVCGGGGEPHVCGCAPTTCAAMQANCGTIIDPCNGATLECGPCGSGDSCGGGGQPNVCGRIARLEEPCETPGAVCERPLLCCGEPGSKLCAPPLLSRCPGPLPDLIVDRVAASASIRFETRTFPPDDCAVMDRCIEPGTRRLLRFQTVTANVGAVDLDVGSPDNQNPDFVYAQCHQHFHYAGYMSHRLLSEAGEVVASGFKPGFCIEDTVRYLVDMGVAMMPKFSCNGVAQGIQRGWADVYHPGLDCQWVDITGVSPGSYVLELRVNPDGKIPEERFGNNVVTIPVAIPP